MLSREGERERPGDERSSSKSETSLLALDQFAHFFFFLFAFDFFPFFAEKGGKQTQRYEASSTAFIAGALARFRAQEAGEPVSGGNASKQALPARKASRWESRRPCRRRLCSFNHRPVLLPLARLLLLLSLHVGDDPMRVF